MNEYRYKLDKGSQKFNCPKCSKKRFVKYIDLNTGKYLPLNYGRCDREDECNYSLDPYKDGYAKSIEDIESGNKTDWKPKKIDLIYTKKTISETYYFDSETFKATLKNYEKNIFIQNLLHNIKYPFPEDEVTKIIELYRLGTISNNYRAGAITFPFIDINQNVRTIQVKEFDRNNNTKKQGTDFLHSMIERHYKRKEKQPPEWIENYNKNDTKVSCLFGEHLLKEYPHNTIALVEAPKTAIYGTLYFGTPGDSNNLLWLAVYSKSTFKLNRIKALQGRNVIVFPDLSKDGNTFDLWSNRAKEFQKKMQNTNFETFDLLERIGTTEQKDKGLDIADILIKHDWRKYRKQQNEPIQAKEEPTAELNTSSIEEKPKEHERIEHLRKRIAETNREINRVEAETARTKATFNQIAERCKIEWFRPKWIKRPNANHLHEINYWLR